MVVELSDMICVRHILEKFGVEAARASAAPIALLTHTFSNNLPLCFLIKKFTRHSGRNENLHVVARSQD